MTTTSVSQSPVNSKGNKRGLHPNCQKNLKPFTKGSPGNKGNPYPVSRYLKDILGEIDADLKRENGRVIAERIIERSKNLTGKADAAILSQLLDRTEGKVPGDGVQVNFNEIKILIQYEQPTVTAAPLEAENDH